MQQKAMDRSSTIWSILTARAGMLDGRNSDEKPQTRFFDFLDFFDLFLFFIPSNHTLQWSGTDHVYFRSLVFSSPEFLLIIRGRFFIISNYLKITYDSFLYCFIVFTKAPIISQPSWHLYKKTAFVCRLPSFERRYTYPVYLNLRL